MVDPRFAEAESPAIQARDQVLDQYSDDTNVIGGDFGQKMRNGTYLDAPAAVIYVVRKLPEDRLPRARLLPRNVQVDGVSVDVDVIETGRVYAYSYTGRERPAPAGISIAHEDVSAGTLGCLVRDRQNNGRLAILSNNHVLANTNDARVGDRILQPGPLDGGRVPGDVIGTLQRFVPINFTGDNHVDCAIARIADLGNVVPGRHGMKEDRMFSPIDGQEAVGLLFAGSPAATWLNPINEVVNRLDVEMEHGAGARRTISGGDLPFRVQKTGRTTEYTTRSVRGVNASVDVDYGGNRIVRFVGQLRTDPMSCGGDSGSVVCAGGTGSSYLPECASSCAVTEAAEDLTGVPFTRERDVIRQARDQYLVSTLLGRWITDLVYVNEQVLLNRAAEADVTAGDRALAQALYSRYIGEVKLALADPDRDDIRLTAQHIQDVETSVASLRKYLTPDESTAADLLMAIIRAQQGKKPRDLLNTLNDEALYDQVRGIFGDVRSIADPYRGR